MMMMMMTGHQIQGYR